MSGGTSHAARRAKTRKSPKNASDDFADKPGLQARAAAHRLLAAIIEASTPMDALTDDAHGHPQYLALDARDRSLVRAILLAALRHRADLQSIIGAMLKSPLPEGAGSVQHILHAGAAQILFLDVADRAAVDLGVEAANRDPRARRFSSLINAILRRIGRERDGLIKTIADNPKSGPDWFADRLVAVYGAEKAAAIDAAHRLEAPFDFTLKRSKSGDAESLAGKLGGCLLPIGTIRVAAGTARANVADLPGFDDGDWWVQDAAAALPAKLMGDLKGKTVLDACAAPGGKTAQLADAGGMVTALDLSKNRLRRLEANMARLDFSDRVETHVADLFAFEPAEGFDAILLDAPCSSTGTVRRHPDVPWVKSSDDIAKLAALQARMLDHVAKLVKPGGMLVFSNCSLDPSEGEAVAGDFLKGHPEFSSSPVGPDEVPGLENCITQAGYLRTTPADMVHPDDPLLSGLDGFFAARFVRRNIEAED